MKQTITCTVNGKEKSLSVDVRQSLLDPNASVRVEYAPVMTPFAGLVGDQEIEAITVWLKTLSSKDY